MERGRDTLPLVLRPRVPNAPARHIRANDGCSGQSLGRHCEAVSRAASKNPEVTRAPYGSRARDFAVNIWRARFPRRGGASRSIHRKREKLTLENQDSPLQKSSNYHGAGHRLGQGHTDGFFSRGKIGRKQSKLCVESFFFGEIKSEGISSLVGFVAEILTHGFCSYLCNCFCMSVAR